MTERQLNAQKVLRKLDGCPIIYDDTRAWVKMTMDLDTYKTMLKVLVSITDEIVVEEEPRPRRVRVV